MERGRGGGLQEGRVCRGEVKNVESFGAFVEIGDPPVQGLVHISQLSQTRVQAASDVVAVGDKVYVKVLSIENQGSHKPKISLSMKYCDQVLPSYLSL
jgi:ribosomal protein S1